VPLLVVIPNNHIINFFYKWKVAPSTHYGRERQLGEAIRVRGRIRRFPASGVRPPLRVDDGGRLRLLCVLRRPVGDRWLDPRRKINSSFRDLLVIFFLLWFLSAKKGAMFHLVWWTQTLASYLIIDE